MRITAGQVAVVTGAASGIGLALTCALAARGVHVIRIDVEARALGSSRDKVTAEATRTEVEDVVLDVTDDAAFVDIQAWVARRFGTVDLLFNNAGVVGPRLPVWQQSSDDFNWVLGVNLGGVINGLRAFLPSMVQAGRGHIVNTASIAALATITGGGNGPYAASKGAIAALSEVLREDLQVAGIPIGVTVLCPGPVRTNIRDAARNRPYAPSTKAGPPAAAPSFTHAVEPVSADLAAELTLAAVQDDRFWVITNTGNEIEVGRRLAWIGDSIRSTPDSLRSG